jgi:hypothetical protein
MPRRDVRRSEDSVHSPLTVRGCLVNIALGSTSRSASASMARTPWAASISRSMTYTTDGNSPLFDHMGIGDHEAAGIHEDPLSRERL